MQNPPPSVTRTPPFREAILYRVGDHVIARGMRGDEPRVHEVWTTEDLPAPWHGRRRFRVVRIERYTRWTNAYGPDDVPIVRAGDIHVDLVEIALDD